MMFRFWTLCGVCSLAFAAPAARADAFDRYTNPLLAKIAATDGVREVKQLAADTILEQDHVLPGVSGAFLVVKTNQGRFSKLLVAVARQKLDNGSSIPILLIERFTTYREGQERATQAAGQHVILFDGFRFGLDIGQVVPAALGGDLRFVVAGEKSTLEPIGNARLYLVTRPLPEAAAPKSAKFTAGSSFDPRSFSGSYKLHDDGRRSGTLTLKVADDGEVSGSYYSDNGGQKYNVTGKIGTPRYSIRFTIKLPRSEQVFQGWLFTGDGKALTGTSRLQEHEAGFYAVRLADE